MIYTNSEAFYTLPKEIQEKNLILVAIQNKEFTDLQIIDFAIKHKNCEKTQNICNHYLSRNRFEANQKNIKKYEIGLCEKLENGKKYVVFSNKLDCISVVFFNGFFYPFKKK